MKKLSFLFLALILFGCVPHQAPKQPAWALAIHGGAGTITKESMTPELEQQYQEKLDEALQAGSEILKNGGTSLDAVCAAINVMEDSPLFNAGKGAVFTAEGINEMDASIMNGENLMAGAVAGVKRIKNPILAARAVMEKSPHVMLMGDGAEKFAQDQGIELVDSSYFFTENRWNSYLKAREKASKENFGTCGAVALDKHGNLAAGTSTGGMTYKMKGRVGDSPIIGAGTYADNNGCAISATGHGEFFIRNVVAFQINALMKYKDLSLDEAARYMIFEVLKPIGGEGGVIALDTLGNISMPFNTAGMYRGTITSDKNAEVKIYGDER
ncbi:MAG: beta-aspartyl-peptidase [Bacteroidetes bacterium HGW-Bacteroidetes-16]|jgi:beta-aspartyl-peptidase (threonine type)|nr:MAG: beta-aspartyl-peptidase [Bacteroidetes bacterium HGW-Bacteroidetes-16]